MKDIEKWIGEHLFEIFAGVIILIWFFNLSPCNVSDPTEWAR